MVFNINTGDRKIINKVNKFLVGHKTRPRFSKHELTCLQWLQEYTHMPTLHQAASESAVFMLLAVETVASEEVDVLIEEVT